MICYLYFQAIMIENNFQIKFNIRNKKKKNYNNIMTKSIISHIISHLSILHLISF